MGNVIPRLPRDPESHPSLVTEGQGRRGKHFQSPNPFAGEPDPRGLRPPLRGEPVAAPDRGPRSTGPRPVAAAEPRAPTPPLHVQSHLRRLAFTAQHKEIRRGTNVSNQRSPLLREAHMLLQSCFSSQTSSNRNEETAAFPRLWQREWA